MNEIAKKQDIIPENTYDAYGAADAVSGQLEQYKTATDKRLDDLEKIDNATQKELDDAVLALGQADASILAKIGAVADDENLVDLIAAAKDAADAAQDDVDALEILVGAVPEGSDTVISYIDKKAEEVLNTVVGDSDETVESVSAALDDYKEENDQKVEAAAGAAEAAQSKADEAYELAGSKATMTEVNTAIANAGHAVATEVEAAFDGINDKIGEVPAGSTVMAEIAKAQTAATYDDTEVRGLISKNEQAIATEKTERAGAISGLKTELEGKINAKVEQTVYDAKVVELVAEDVRLAGLIGDNAAAIETLVDADAGKSVRTIANEELAAQLIPTNAAEALDTLQEIAKWIQDHPGDAAAMNAEIDALKLKVDIGEQTVSTYVSAAIEALKIGDYATVSALGEAVNRIIALEQNSATKTELAAVSKALEDYQTEHENDYDNDAIDKMVKDVQDQIDVLGDTYATDEELAQAIADEIERANDAYAGKGYEGAVDSHTKDTDIHVTTEDKTKWNSAQANAEATAASELSKARGEITNEIGTAKGEAISEASGLADSAKAAAVGEAAGMVQTAKEELNLAIKGNTDAITKINGDENTEGSFAKADASVLTDAKDYADNKIAELLQWGEF
jgi:hypothetical protein